MQTTCTRRLCSKKNWRGPRDLNLWNPGCPATISMKILKLLVTWWEQKYCTKVHQVLLEYSLATLSIKVLLDNNPPLWEYHTLVFFSCKMVFLVSIFIHNFFLPNRKIITRKNSYLETEIIPFLMIDFLKLET